MTSDVAARHERYRGAGRFLELDGVRAVAILLVLGGHVAGGRASSLLERGLGVSAFFCISGLIITALLLRDRRRTGSVAVVDFYVRRGLRTLPLYYAVLAAYVLLVLVVERGTPAGSQFFSNLPSFATFTSNWFVRDDGHHTIFYFAWSLAAQEQFYLLWPLLVRCGRPWWLPPLVMAALFAAGEWGTWAVAAGYLEPLGVTARLLEAIPTPICLGAAAAYALEHPRAFEWTHRVTGHAWTPLLWLAAVMAPSFVDLGPGAAAFGMIALLLLIVNCVICPGNVLQPLLRTRFARHLGTVAYGVYLLHMLALNLSRRLLPGRGPLALFLATSGLSVVAASASYAWFEKPITDAGKAWLAARRCRRSGAAPGPSLPAPPPPGTGPPPPPRGRRRAPGPGPTRGAP